MSCTVDETALMRDAPPMPDPIDAILHEEWSKLDPDADRMMAFFKESRAFHEFAHASKPFAFHLRNTWAMLCAWNMPQ